MIRGDEALVLSDYEQRQILELFNIALIAVESGRKRTAFVARLQKAGVMRVLDDIRDAIRQREYDAGASTG